MDVQPDPKGVRFQLPDKFKDERRLRNARRMAAISNYTRKVEQEARNNRREREMRRREEEEEESASLSGRMRWKDGKLLRRRCRISMRIA